MSDPHVVDKEMGITHREFFRVMRRALDGRPHAVGTEGVRIEDRGRRLDIRLFEETERRIALMTVPVTRVRLTFRDYTEDETAETLAWFDRWFQRGGG